MNYTILLISALILLSSFVITMFLDKRYSFPKLSAFLLFYYFLIVVFAMGASKFLKFKHSRLIGSILGFVVSLLLWFKFGDYSKIN
jgi:hypothetical protein